MTDDRLAALENRVAELERLLAPEEGELDTALLTRLRHRNADGDVRGGVQFAGSVNIRGRRAAWQSEHTAEDLLTTAEEAAPVLAAAAHPARIAILAALLDGPLEVAVLETRVELGSKGRLYHHLKELVSAGLISQPRRSEYALPVRNVVPVLTLLAAASDLRGD